VPDVDLMGFEDESIIDAFKKESVFFWSEEYAKESRRNVHGISGIYFNIGRLPQRLKISKAKSLDLISRIKPARPRTKLS
jgi:hypothetical protein